MAPEVGLAADRELARRLHAGIEAVGVALDPQRESCLLAYLALLERWNRAYNLTAVSGREAMVARHLLDVLAVLPWVRGPRVLDVGSGAGLPGMVLAIAAPQLELTLLDAALKRTRFLVQASHELGLRNVQVVRARLSEHCAPGGYDTVVSRATLGPRELAAQGARLLAPGGAILAMLGRAVPGLAGALSPAWTVEMTPLTVPGLPAERHLARIVPRA